VGKEAPDFQVRQLDGTVARLSDFRGRPVWLSFWATWCPPCRAESAEIEAVSRTYGPSGLVVLAVDIGEDQQAVESYVQRAQLTYLIGFDPGEQIAALYRVSGLPNHFFIDAAGVLREWRVGPVEREGLAKSLTVILPAGVPAPPAN
jgi:peroxiredoxin